MARTGTNPAIDQIEQARVSIRNGWTQRCREKRRREARARLVWLAGLLRKQIVTPHKLIHVHRHDAAVENLGLSKDHGPRAWRPTPSRSSRNSE